jgi:hypothetical protein
MALEPLERLDIRLFVADPNAVDWTDTIPLFTRWIQEEPDRWLDLADYRHVPSGPGVILIGKDCHVAMDNRRDEPALLFSRREPYEGSNRERIASALRDAFAFAERLSRDLPRIRFRQDVCEFAVNDRVAFPNEPEIAGAVEAELRAAVAEQMPGAATTFEYDANPKERVTFRVRVGG